MQVSKWGNSLAVRLPASVVEILGLRKVTTSKSTWRVHAYSRSRKSPEHASCLRA